MERLLRAFIEGDAGFDGADLALQRPVAAQLGAPGQVGRGGDVGFGEPGELGGGSISETAFAEVAAVNQDVGILAEVLADFRQLLAIGLGHREHIERCGADLQHAL